MEKRSWQKPELIVLVRSHPEEAVLAGCKISSSGSGANTRYFNCFPTPRNGGSCTRAVACSDSQTS